jgi:hypothetical protein
MPRNSCHNGAPWTGRPTYPRSQEPDPPQRRDPKPVTRAAASLYHDFFAWTCIWPFDAVPRSILHGPHAPTSGCCVSTHMRLSVYTMLALSLSLSCRRAEHASLRVYDAGRPALSLSLSLLSQGRAGQCGWPHQRFFVCLLSSSYAVLLSTGLLTVCLLLLLSDESDLTGIIRTARYCLSAISLTGIVRTARYCMSAYLSIPGDDSSRK